MSPLICLSSPLVEPSSRIPLSFDSSLLGLNLRAWKMHYAPEIQKHIKLVDFLIGHYTYRMFPPAIDIIPTSLAVVYSNGKYTNYKN